MKNQEFLIWGDGYIEGYCVIEAPEGVKKAYQLEEGVELLTDWPSGVICRMNDDFRKDIQCSDNLYGAGIRIISERVKNFLISEGVDSVEFLPLTILNHKGRAVVGSYFIVNPPYVINCIDLGASQVEWNDIDSELIDSCKQLVVNNELIPNKESIFRPKNLPIINLIRSDLAEKLTDAGFSGFIFRDPLKYKGV